MLPFYSRRTLDFKLPKLLAFLFVFAASLANAQTMDPHIVEFDPSPDHNTLLPGGLPMVVRYDLQFFYSGASQPFQVMDIGKPTPDVVDGKIRLDFVSYLQSWPLPLIVYEARVGSIGSTGSTDSAPSNRFTFSGSCAYAVTPTALSFPGSGGTGNVNVWAGAACPWLVTSSAAWVTINTAGSSGNGVLSFTVASNPTTSARVATVTANTAVVTIDQAAGVAPVATTVTVAPATATVAAGATTTLTATVKNQNGQPMPSAAVTWSVTPTGVVTLAPNGQTVTVTGAAAGTATVKATSGTVNGTATVTVTVPAPVATTVTVAPATATVAAGATTTLTATVKIQNGQPMPSAAVTWSVTPTGVVTLAPNGQTVTVTGAAAGTATVKATSGSVNGTATVNRAGAGRDDGDGGAGDRDGRRGCHDHADGDGEE